MAELRALIFDVDGTLAETEEGHREAFNAVFADYGLPWVWDRELYRELLRVTGGKERILHYARTRDPERLAETAARMAAVHEAKNARYAQWVRASGGALRPGVRRLIEEARASGLRLAIATTTSRANVEALLGAAFGGNVVFDVMVCGEDVHRKKPDPEVYAVALRRLELPAGACLAFEDSRNGLLSARAAGLRTVLTPSVYSAGEDVSEAWVVARDLDRAADGASLTIEGIAALWAA